MSAVRPRDEHKNLQTKRVLLETKYIHIHTVHTHVEIHFIQISSTKMFLSDTAFICLRQFSF